MRTATGTGTGLDVVREAGTDGDVTEGGDLEVLVSDQGVGIEPEEIDKIFTKFYRVKHPKTRQVPPRRRW